MAKNGKSKADLLTIQEQRFYAFWRQVARYKLPQAELARRFDVSRQRVYQLMERLKAKGRI
jgi:biotin operon repressor